MPRTGKPGRESPGRQGPSGTPPRKPFGTGVAERRAGTTGQKRHDGYGMTGT
jgi:hypothetical protein